MKPFIVAGMLLLGSAGMLRAQGLTGSVRVKITESSGKPLPFASVLLRQAKDSSLVKGELSGADGSCSFDKIAEGRYFVHASLLGYNNAFSQGFTIDKNHRAIVLPPLLLAASAKNLQGVTVSAQKPFIERKAGATVLNVESSISSAGSTALDLLRKAPGVTVDKDDNILIRGAQGATVMIDGKLTYLSGEQLANLLKSLPSETISQIEIMTSPSAKYDAAGNSGIINIKTKKGVVTGINGTWTGSIGSGRYPFYNTGINLNWRTEKFNVFGNYNYGSRNMFNDRLLTRHIQGNEPQLFSQSIFQKMNFTSNNYKAGIDYFITPRHTIGAMVNGYANRFRRDAWSNTSISTGNRMDSILHTFSAVNNRFNNTAYNLNYKGQLDTSTGKEISVDADLARFNYRRRLHLNDSLEYLHGPGNRTVNAIRNFTYTDITIKSLKADLVLPLNKTTRIETGAKASFVTTDNTLQYDSMRNGKYIPALSQSNQFVYKENVLAVYGTFKKQFTKTDIQAGIRMEATSSDGHSVTLQTRVKRHYTDLFPNLSIDHKFSDNHKLSFSYTRRINRPDYDDLNPFLFFLDKYTYFRGNPFLNPEYTHTTELSYTLRQKYIATISYSLTSNIMLEYLEQDDVTKVTTATSKNFQQRHRYALSLTIPVDPFKWWSSSNNINFYYNNFNVKDTSVNVTSAILSVGYEGNNTFTLPRDWKLELGGYYNSPFVYGVFRGKAYFAVNAGVQKTLLDKKATIKVNVNDIFNGDQFRGTAQYNNINMRIHNRWQNRTVNLTLSYRFGNSNIKAARERQTGTSEEQQRAGS